MNTESKGKSFQKNIPLIVITGPTASGKSEAAMRMAEELGGEVVSADSLQVYRYFDIGTAKTPLSWRKRIPHHLIDICEPTEHYDAAIFQRDADRAIAQLWERRKVPVIAGGTGLYIRALLRGLFQLPGDRKVRDQLHRRLQIEGLSQLYRELKEIDPEYAEKISPNDRIRIVRALEVFYISSKTFSEWSREHGHQERRYPFKMYVLSPPREELYRRIEVRTAEMLREGWITEVLSLRRRYPPDIKPMQSIGYREINAMLDGDLEPELLLQKIVKNTKSYAKRQLTWFKKEEGIWLRRPEELFTDQILGEIREFVAQYLD